MVEQLAGSTSDAALKSTSVQRRSGVPIVTYGCAPWPIRRTRSAERSLRNKSDRTPSGQADCRRAFRLASNYGYTLGDCTCTKPAFVVQCQTMIRSGQRAAPLHLYLRHRLSSLHLLPSKSAFASCTTQRPSLDPLAQLAGERRDRGKTRTHSPRSRVTGSSSRQIATMTVSAAL